MKKILTDPEIKNLITEEKNLPFGYHSVLSLKEKRGHRENEITVNGVAGNDFRIILRRNEFDVLDFSIILCYLPKESTAHFRLCRYNGKSHEHTNILENEAPFYDFHIHVATQKYQEEGLREDWYAQRTDRYSSFEEAIQHFIKACNIIKPKGPQAELFEEEP